ncbi:MAG: hypothetical protein PVF83_08735 [Anaerolineales bacterium]|jgi:mono/diheme cytochrome c family protein
MNLFANKKLSLLLLSLVFVFLLAACGGNAAEETAPPAADTMDEHPAATDEMPTETEAPSAEETAVSFANQVLPIFNSRCAQCHGGDRTFVGLDVLSFAALMSGSENGPVVVPGDADASLLVTLVANGQMPKAGAKLTPDQLQLIADWINQGALDN